MPYIPIPISVQKYRQVVITFSSWMNDDNNALKEITEEVDNKIAWWLDANEEAEIINVSTALTNTPTDSEGGNVLNFTATLAVRFRKGE